MLSKKKIAELVNHGISRKPLALHGTSIEGLLKLFDDETLPTGRHFGATRNYLYFSITNYGFRGTKFDGAAPMYTKRQALYHAGIYATNSAKTQYIMNALVSAGISSSHVYKVYLNFEEGFEFRAPKEELEKAEKLGDWWGKTRSEARKRYGVILEASESILELKLLKDPDKDGLRIFCPNGLDVKYFSGVKLLGKQEKQILEDYLAGR
ncbi:MAG: hypothetical protein NTY99_03830 [DPANN group archaeon]|nr:hypothetical protein [DPANN group archaeon]